MPNEVSQEEQISAAMEQMQNLIKNEGKNGTNATFTEMMSAIGRHAPGSPLVRTFQADAQEAMMGASIGADPQDAFARMRDSLFRDPKLLDAVSSVMQSPGGKQQIWIYKDFETVPGPDFKPGDEKLPHVQFKGFSMEEGAAPSEPHPSAPAREARPTPAPAAASPVNPRLSSAMTALDRLIKHGTPDAFDDVMAGINRREPVLGSFDNFNENMTMAQLANFNGPGAAQHFLDRIKQDIAKNPELLSAVLTVMELPGGKPMWQQGPNFSTVPGPGYVEGDKNPGLLFKGGLRMEPDAVPTVPQAKTVQVLKDKIRPEGMSVAFKALDEFVAPSQNQAHKARIAPQELSKPAPDAAIQQAAVMQPAIQPVRHTGFTA